MHWQKKIIPFVCFVIVASPETFKMTQAILGKWVASSYGVPTTAGLLLHALVFVLLSHFVWRMVWGQKRSSYSGMNSLQTGNNFDDQMYSATNARGVQGLGIHPESFGDDSQ